MEIFTKEGLALLFRWFHILAGITWIGLLYYFNFVQGPSFAAFDAGARTEATRKLVPRALFWFRYAALTTWLAGVGMILIRIEQADDVAGLFGSSYGVAILTGMILGTIMFLNVWGVIWPNQKIVIANAEGTAAGREADPRAAGAARRALLASRTNVIFSVPMVFFMATASHLSLFGQAATSRKTAYWIIGAVVIALLELNALAGSQGATKKPLEKVRSVITAGFVFYGVLYTVLQVLTRETT